MLARSVAFSFEASLGDASTLPSQWLFRVQGGQPSMIDVLERVFGIAVQEAVRRHGSVTNERLLALVEKFGLSAEQLVSLKARLKAEEVGIEGDVEDEGPDEEDDASGNGEDEGTTDGPDEPDEPADAELADYSALDAYLRDARREDLLDANDEVDLMRAIRAGEEARAKLSGDVPPDLRPGLEKLVRAGQRARDQFIKANLRLVVSIAKTIPSRGDLAFGDVVQEGNLGLIRAVEKFDHTRGFRFSTYASYWIIAKIHRAIDDRGQVVRLPVHLRRQLLKLRRVESALTREKKGDSPGLSEIAQHMGMTPGFIRFLMDVRRRPVSLDRSADEDGTTFADMLPASEDSKPDVGVVERDLLSHVSDAISHLETKQQKILRLRFGMDGGDGMTLREIGDEMGVTRERIRQLQNDAIDALPLKSRAIAEVLGPERMAEVARERREKKQLAKNNQATENKKLASKTRRRGGK